MVFEVRERRVSGDEESKERVARGHPLIVLLRRLNPLGTVVGGVNPSRRCCRRSSRCSLGMGDHLGKWVPRLGGEDESFGSKWCWWRSRVRLYTFLAEFDCIGLRIRQYTS